MAAIELANRQQIEKGDKQAEPAGKRNGMEDNSDLIRGNAKNECCQGGE